MTASIKIEGLKELNRELKKLEARTARTYTRAALASGATVIRKEMRQRAPRKTGYLRKNIRYRIQNYYGRGWTGRVGATKSAFYARFIEYGTDPHPIPNPTVGFGRNRSRNKAVVAIGGKVYNKVDNPGVSARPFLRPAFHASKDRAVTMMGRTLWEKIKTHQR